MADRAPAGQLSPSAAQAQILEAASALLLEGGVAALSVRAIAKRAGTSTMGIYSHFQGKEGVLDALYQQGFERLTAAMQEAAEVANARDGALLGTRLYLSLAVDYESHYRLMFGERMAEFQPSADSLARAAAAFRGLVHLVTRLMPSDTPPAQRLHSALAFWAQLHGYVSLKQQVLWSMPDMDDWQDQVLQVTTAMIDRLAQGEL